jgi:glycoside/pentoside/hexuronide:cation symporter, GPH family
MSPPKPLRFPEKFAYGFGDFASCIFWATFSNFLLIFYTDVFGITAAAAGGLLFWSRIFDGVNDPMIGALADRTHTRWGKFRPYLLWLCVPFAIAGVLCFTTPDADMIGKIIWAWITYNLLMVLYTAINIPYNSMLGVITSDPIDRTSVSSFKFFFAFGAGVFVKATLPFLTYWLGEDGTNLQKGYQLTFVLYGVIVVICFLISFWFTQERVSPPKGQQTPLTRDIADLVTNRPWLILLATTITFILFVATRDTITAHYVKYYIGEQTVTLPFVGTRVYGYEAAVTAFLFIGAIGSLLGVLVVTFFARLVGKKTAFITLLLISVLINASYYFLKPEHLELIFGLQFISSLTGGPMSVLLWAMYADTADYGEWKRGRRATGLVFSASTMSQKFGWAICGWAAGQMLTLTGFVANAPVQNPDVLDGLRHMMSTVPAAFGVLAIIIVLFFPLSEKRMAEIETELNARRRKAAQET